MTRIESKHQVIPRSADHVFEFLTDLKNVELLLPKEKISNFQSDNEKFSFKITGAIPVELKLVEKKPSEYLKFVTTEKNTFQFTLEIFIQAQTDSSCNAYQICNADINPFMKMMVEKPLTALFDYMVDRLLAVSSEK